MDVDDDDDVFRALADPTRRRLLDHLLVHDGARLADLEGLADMTRFGVMKHLRVLEDAGLVTSRRAGREKLHYVNVVPIRLIHDRWIDKYRVGPASALADLKRELEQEIMTTTQIYHVFIRASADEIWEAITRPEHTVRYFYGARIDTTAQERVNRGPDGSDWGTEAVLEFDPPRRLVHEWRSGYDEQLATEPASRVTWEISPHDDGTCLVTLTHDRLDESPKTAEGVGGTGWMYVLSALKTVLETGAPLVKSP